MSAKSCFRIPFNKQHKKRTQTLLQSAQPHLYHIYWPFWTYISWKMSMLVPFKILRLFVNTLTDDDKYSLLNKDNLTQPIQIILSQKRKALSQFFAAFLKWTLNIAHFRKKDDPHSWCISEITVSEFVRCRILRLFANTLTADDKYPLLNRDNLTQPIQITLSQKQKTFSHFSPHFWELH